MIRFHNCKLRFQAWNESHGGGGRGGGIHPGTVHFHWDSLGRLPNRHVGFGHNPKVYSVHEKLRSSGSMSISTHVVVPNREGSSCQGHSNRLPRSGSMSHKPIPQFLRRSRTVETEEGQLTGANQVDTDIRMHLLRDLQGRCCNNLP